MDTIRAKAADDDTRLRAIDWIHANVPDGATILVDSYTTQVSSDRYEVLMTWGGELHRWSDVSDKLRPDGWFSTIGAEWHGTPARLLETLATHDVDYVVLNQQWIDLYRARGPSGRDLVAVYDGLLAAFPVVRTFDHDDASVGWPNHHPAHRAPARPTHASGTFGWLRSADCGIEHRRVPMPAASIGLCPCSPSAAA